MAVRRRMLFMLGAALTVAASSVGAEQIVWQLGSLRQLGGHQVRIAGEPKRIASPFGPAIRFDGDKDSLLIDGRPLVGARTFTIEAIFQPEEGSFEQRFLHIAETDPTSGKDFVLDGTADQNARFMFEVRVVPGGWYLDAYVKSKAGARTLAPADKVHPLGRWYAVAQTYDGQTYRAYVDGILQGEAAIGFEPHGPGHVRIGARMNQVTPFKGSVARLRFTDRALSPDEFIKTSDGNMRK